MPADYEYDGKDTNPRFFMHLDNALFYNGGVISKPHVHCNGDASSFWASYWNGNATTSTALQFELVEAVTNDERIVVTVHFPNYNFSPMSFSSRQMTARILLKKSIVLLLNTEVWQT